MRHCVRSMYPTLRGRGDPNFDYADNYTARPFPGLDRWKSDGVAHCTERGLELAEAFGKSLQDAGLLPAPVSVLADNVSRCVDTANHLVRGLGPNSTFHGITKALDPVKQGLCRPASPKNKTFGVQSMIGLASSGKSYLSEAWKQHSNVMSELQDLVGKGHAASIVDIPTKIDDEGNYVGGMHVASQGMIENFILEAGTGISVAWGALDGKKGRKLLWERYSPLNVLYNRINHNGIPLATRDGAVVLGIMQLLLNKALGSQVLVGHDTNVDSIAALLDLTWSCGPFPDNETPPYIGLMFEREGDSVAIKVICTAFDDSDKDVTPGKALVGEVRKGEQTISNIAIDKLIAEARSHIGEWGGLDCAAVLLLESSVRTIFS